MRPGAGNAKPLLVARARVMDVEPTETGGMGIQDTTDRLYRDKVILAPMVRAVSSPGNSHHHVMRRLDGARAVL